MESTYANWKSLRNGVIVSVIVLYLIEPAMNVAIDLFPSIGGRVYGFVWDQAAAQAAVGGDYVDFAMFAILFSAIVGAFIGRFGAGSQIFARRGRRAAESVWARWEKRLVLLLLMLIAPMAGVTLMIDFAAQRMKLSFEQRIAVLAPAISEEDEELFRGRFADLSGRNAYQSLTNDMEQIARNNRVILPPPLL